MAEDNTWKSVTVIIERAPNDRITPWRATVKFAGRTEYGICMTRKGAERWARRSGQRLVRHQSKRETFTIAVKP